MTGRNAGAPAAAEPKPAAAATKARLLQSVRRFMGTADAAREGSVADGKSGRLPGAASVHRLMVGTDGLADAEWALRRFPTDLIGWAATNSRRLDVRPHALALSLPSALFNHSCAPNCHTDHRLINGQLTFRALRRIDPGEECTIAYVATEEPTYWRRRALLRSKLFLCTCAVCTDPTDGERCGGSLVCKACNQGWLREGSSSGAIGTGGDWVCSRAPSSCSGSMRLSELIAWDDAQRRRPCTGAAPIAGPHAQSRCNAHALPLLQRRAWM